MVLPSLQQGRDLITPWQASKTGGSEVASEAPLSDRPARDRHQLKTLLLAIAILSTILLAAFLAIGVATWLIQYGFLHFPLGFYLLAQGLLIFIVVATFWFIHLQDRLDQTRSENEDLG
jgi:putative solute:sodium symporter small subunit